MYSFTKPCTSVPLEDPKPVHKNLQSSCTHHVHKTLPLHVLIPKTMYHSAPRVHSPYSEILLQPYSTKPCSSVPFEDTKPVHKILLQCTLSRNRVPQCPSGTKPVQYSTVLFPIFIDLLDNVFPYLYHAESKFFIFWFSYCT